MPVAPVPVDQAIDGAKLGHSRIDRALTEFTRDVMLGTAPVLKQREPPFGTTSSPRKKPMPS